MQDKVIFLKESLKAFAATKLVLDFYGLAVERADDLDYKPYVEAMLKLCQEHSRDSDSDGIEHLRRVTDVFDAVRPPFKAVTSDQLKDGTDNAARYKQWLQTTFPDAQRNRSGLN